MLHIDFPEVAGGSQRIKGDLFVLADVLGSEHDGLVFLYVFLGLDPYLQPTHLVVPVYQLQSYIPGVYHELYSHPQGLFSNTWQDLCLYFQDKDEHELVGLTNSYFAFLKVDILFNCELFDPLQKLVLIAIQFQNILLLELFHGYGLNALLGYFGRKDVLVDETARLHDVDDPDNIIVGIVWVLLLYQQDGVESIENCYFVGYSVQFIH